MARSKPFSASMRATTSAQTSAVRTVERSILRSEKVGGDWIDIIKGGVRAVLGGGSGPRVGPTPLPQPTFGQPPPSGGGGGPCDLLPGFLADACRAVAGGIGGGGGGNGAGGFVAPNPCPAPLIRNPITGNCIDPTALPPGGRPAFVAGGGNATMGAFGLPAMTPAQHQRTRLACPTGMVLGKDDLCYPKAILSTRSKFRKWRPAPRAKITAAEWKTLQRASRVAARAKDVAQEAGFKVLKK